MRAVEFLRGLAYRPDNPAGLKRAIAVFVILVLVNQVLAAVIGIGMHLALEGGPRNEASIIKYMMVGLLPAGIATMLLAIAFAYWKGGRPVSVLALNSPRFGPGGWLLAVGGFLVVMYAFIALATTIMGIDESKIGLVESAMRGLGQDPLFPLIALAISLAAPLAEEVTFRGQIFAALSRTRLGYSGTAVITSAAWAALHITEPLHAVAMLFVMGLALSYLLVRFGSLWVPIVCHAVWNAIVTYASFAMGAS